MSGYVNYVNDNDFLLGVVADAVFVPAVSGAMCLEYLEMYTLRTFGSALLLTRHGHLLAHLMRGYQSDKDMTVQLWHVLDATHAIL